MVSAQRMMKAPSRPPRRPASIPMALPKTMPNRTEPMPMVREMRAPRKCARGHRAEIVRAEHEGAVRRVEAHMDVLSQRVEGGKLWREHRHKQHT